MATSSTSSISQIDHGKVEIARCKTVDDQIVLDLPVDKVEGEALPEVTIVTVTRNRKRFFPLAIDNWKHIYYPEKKLTWLIIDDSDDVKADGPIELVKALKDSRVKFWYEAPRRDESGNIVPHTVGYKRNLAMSLVTSELVAFVDDDDYLFDESILARVCALRHYGKSCVYSDELGIYNAPQQASYVLEGFEDVPEGTIMLTKEFWAKHKFGETMVGEGRQLVQGQELQMLRIPYFFNLIVLNHSSNITGSGRTVRFKWDGKMRDKASVSAPLNFWKKFRESFRSELKTLVLSATKPRVTAK